VRKLTRVWQERYVELAGRPEIEYVFIFENKGKEIGVTLSHPHGQIYAYPYIPPVLKTELDAERAHMEKSQSNLWNDWLEGELEAMPGQGSREERLVHRNATFLALVPFFARYPYEVWIAPAKHFPSIAEMGAAELDDLAEILLVVTRKYDLLFGFSMPYIMAMHQQPTVPGYEFTRFHVEFYPPYRTAEKLKYLAGSEAAAGAFINDTLPEETAKRLRDLSVTVDRAE